MGHFIEFDPVRETPTECDTWNKSIHLKIVDVKINTCLKMQYL